MSENRHEPSQGVQGTVVHAQKGVLSAASQGGVQMCDATILPSSNARLLDDFQIGGFLVFSTLGIQHFYYSWSRQWRK